jgi:hypothetical protein
MDFFLLPVSIELARVEGDAPDVPDAIKGSYANSISELGLVATRALNRGVSDPCFMKVAQAAQLVAQGMYAEASHLLDEQMELFQSHGVNGVRHHNNS